MARSGLRTAAVLAVLAAAPVTARFVTQRASTPPGEGGARSGKLAPNTQTVPAKQVPGGVLRLPGPEEHICDFLSEYLGVQPPVNSDSVCPGVPPHDLKVIIAIVPDPVHTHLALRFDRAIDDIQDAAQDLGWSFNSSWLPWDDKTHSEPDRYLERQSDLEIQHDQENAPGVLLFRGRDDKAPLKSLIVLVVGDTPTSGVNPEQFREAMGLWARLVYGTVQPKPGTPYTPPALSILGPTFSGSAQSLHQLLSQELHQPTTVAKEKAPTCSLPAITQVNIASGTMMKSDLLFDLQTVADPCGGVISVEAVSFGMDIQYMSSYLADFLERHNLAGRLASLSEKESSFGRRTDSSRPAPDPPGSLAADRTGYLQTVQTTQGKLACPTSDSSCDARKTEVMLRIQNELARLKLGYEPPQYPALYFPREISRLRKAYEQNSIIGFGSSATSPRTQLSLSSADDFHDDDTVTTFSHQQDVLAMETEMSQIVSTLTEQRIDTVMLSATDVFDEIFVARYLQQHAPRIAVIIEDADLLFLRTGTDAGIDGAFIASAWPLIPENQSWSAPANMPQRVFPAYQSQGDQGLHAAALRLLWGDTPLPQQSSAFPNALAQYRPPVGSPTGDLASRPPIWLSVIGHGRFSPISLVDVDQAGSRVTPLSQTNLPPITASGTPSGIAMYRPLSAKLIAALVAVLLLWHGLACIFSRLDRRFAWTYALAGAEHRTRRLWIQAGISFTAVPALSLLWTPSVPGFTAPSGILFQTSLFALQLLACCLAGFSIVRWWNGRRSEIATRRDVRIRSVIVGVPLLVLAALVHPLVWPLIEPASSRVTERIFFLYRSALMVPGISPALTMLLLLAVLTIWLHSHFGRFAFFGHRIPKLPEKHEDIHCPGPTLEPVTSLFCEYWGTNIFILAITAVFVIFGIRLSGTWGPTSIENGRFDIVVRILAAFVAVLILHDVAVAVWGWQLLHQRCLLRLKRSPLRWGFTWIKGFSWQRVWTSSRTLSPEVIFDYLARLLEANRRAAMADVSLQAAYQPLITLYYSRDTKDEQWSKQVADLFADLHAALARTADKHLDALKLVWSTDRGPLTGTGPDEVRGTHLLQPLTEVKDPDRLVSLDRMAREEFVALLYLGYIRMVLIQIRTRILTACVCYVLLLWALTSYPWTNHHAIIIGLSAMLAVISLAILFVYSGMHRDDILSRTTETTPGKLDPEFFQKTVPTIGIPLLSLVASQFPEFSSFIFSFVEPGLRGQ